MIARRVRAVRPLAAGRVAIAGLVALVLIVAIGSSLLGRQGDLAPLGPPRFAEEAEAAGIHQSYDGPDTAFVGGGVAVLDCDGDGRPDLYLAGGAAPAALYRNESATGGALRFTRSDDPTTELVGVSGAYPIDIDGDGTVDLAVLRVGGVDLLRGLGDCRFERANEALAFDGGAGWTSAFSATWEGDATLPTMAIGNYLALDADGAPGTRCAPNALVRPAADGRAYAPAIALAPGYCTLSILFSDWDRSGRRDLRMTNDRHYYVDGEEQLWRIAPGEAPRAYTAADGWQPMEIWGMGIASYDLDGDGYPEVYLTSQGDNKLQTLASGPSTPTYRDIALPRGVTSTRPYAGDVDLPSTAWHPEFQDVNNDGLVDLFVSKGNVGQQPDYARRDPGDLFLGQADGTFSQAAGAAGITTFDRGRGAAFADFNLDGLLDLVEVDFGAPVKLWRNLGAASSSGGPARAMGHWLALSVNQPGPNHDAIGAWLEVRTGDRIQRRELTIGGGHASGELGWIHVGLGTATDAQVRVQWPDGAVGPWLDARADGFGIVRRDSKAVEPWRPPAP